MFARNFFPAHDPFVGLLSAFAVFAVSYLVRPIGGVILGHIADRRGRSYALYLSAAAMTASTVIIGLLPTYAGIGVIAPLLLIAARLVQGVSIGGEHTSSLSFLAENAPPERRGLVTSFAASGAPTGILLGALAAALVSELVSQQALFDWAWRIPFLAGIVLGGFTLYLRFGRAQLAEPTAPRSGTPPIVEALKFDGRNIVRALALSGALGAGFYIVAIYPRHVPAGRRCGRRPRRPALQQRDPRHPSHCRDDLLVALRQARPQGGALRRPRGTADLHVAAVFAHRQRRSHQGARGTDRAFRAARHLFRTDARRHGRDVPPNARVSALALSYNISQGLIGGTAPLLATYLVEGAGLRMGPAVYLIVLAGIALIAALSMTERSGSRFPEAQDADPERSLSRLAGERGFGRAGLLVGHHHAVPAGRLGVIEALVGLGHERIDRA